MTITIKNNIDLDVIIEKKMSTKNLYIRMKDPGTLKVTCNTFTPDFEIKKFINSHIKEIERMYDFTKKKEEYDKHRQKKEEAKKRKQEEENAIKDLEQKLPDLLEEALDKIFQ